MAGNLITSYTTLQQAMQDWLARTDWTDNDVLPEIIQAGELRLYEGFEDNRGNYYPGLRVRQMQKAFPGGNINSLVIVPGAAYAAADTIAFPAPPAGGVQATGLLVLGAGGKITGCTLTNPGMGYTAAQLVGVITTATGNGGSVTANITATPTISPSGNVAVPADYLDLEYLILTNSGGLTNRCERKSAAWIYQYWPDRTADNIPAYIGRDGLVFIFGPYPDSTYAMQGFYYYKDTPLSDAYESNWITANYPSLLFASCMAEAMSFAEDDEGQGRWEKRYMSLARSIQLMTKREDISGGPMAMLPG